jgi:hypothetical protein
MNSQTDTPHTGAGTGVFDRLIWGIHFDATSSTTDLGQALRGRVATAGASATGSDRRRLRVVVPNQAPGLSKPSVAELNLSTDQDRLVVTAQSNLDMNAIRMIRALVGGVPAGDCLDGNDNFLGPVSLAPEEVQRLQLAEIKRQVDDLGALIDSAMPEDVVWGQKRLWLRHAELCHEIAVEDAPMVILWLQRSAPAGVMARNVDLYRMQAAQTGLAPAIRYWRSPNGPELKIYAKTATVLRVEVVCRSRRVLKHFDGNHYADQLPGDDAQALLAEIWPRAQVLLDQLTDHAREAASGARSVCALLDGILPILQLAAGGGGGGRGRPAGPKVSTAARGALEALFTYGWCRALDQRKGTALRAALDRASSPSGPLVRAGQKAHFSLRPAFAHAAHQIVART